MKHCLKNTTTTKNLLKFTAPQSSFRSGRKIMPFYYKGKSFGESSLSLSSTRRPMLAT